MLGRRRRAAPGESMGLTDLRFGVSLADPRPLGHHPRLSEPSVWPSVNEWVAFSLGVLIGSVILLAVLRVSRPISVTSALEEDFRSLVQWEMERTLALSKGMAGSSIGFLVALATAL